MLANVFFTTFGYIYVVPVQRGLVSKSHINFS